jgi:L-fuconolactonase
MVTEATYNQWKREDFTPYIDAVVEAFGTNRIMFGSDWPVCQVSASYEQTIGIVKDYFTPFTLNEQALFFGKNAAQFYHL